MDQNNGYFQNEGSKALPSEGFLVVRVSTARGAIPLEGASVIIQSSEIENSGIKYSLRSDADGITQKVALPTPSIGLSESPNNSGEPYSLWNIRVFKNGYIPLTFQNVPVYSSVVSIQPAVMIPFSENFTTSETVNESSRPNL